MGLLKWFLGCSQKNGKRGTVDYNAHKMRKKYSTTKGGYFGEKGKSKGKASKKEPVRVIRSKNQFATANDFYSKISKGGKEKSLSNGHGKQKIMKDGGRVVYREKTSTPDSPAVNLSEMQGKVKNQKIHFEKEKKDE